MEIVVTDITTQVEIEAGQELFEVIVTVADSESAERFAIEAKESADEAAISAGIATVKASEAVVSASNALTSENEAESAATTATEQAILSAAARDEAVAAKLAAQDSEDNALISALDASLSASNALASKNAAELAASTIVDKIDFTGAVEGDLYRVNALGVAEPINETEFLKSKVPFLNSPLAGMMDLNNVIVYDSLNRSNGALGNTDSGHPWVTLQGTTFTIDGNRLRTAINLSTNPTSNSINGIQLPKIGSGLDRGNFKFITNLSSSLDFSVLIFRNVINFLEIRISLGSRRIDLFSVVEGVSTLLASSNLLPTIFSNSILTLEISFFRTAITEPSPNSYISIICKEIPEFNITLNNSAFTTAVNSIFPTPLDVDYFAIMSSSRFNLLNNLLIQQLYNIV